MMMLSPLPAFNLTRFPILTIVGYLVGSQCNSGAYFDSEKCYAMGFDLGPAAL